MEMIIGLAIGVVVILLTVAVTFYVISCVKALKVLDKLVDLYEPMLDKLEDMIDDI